MSSGQLSLLKQLTNSHGFSTERSADSEVTKSRDPQEGNIATLSCQSSLEEEEEEEEEEVRGCDDSDEDGDDDDDDDDGSSYESETLDKTESTDDNLSSESSVSSQVSLEQVVKNEATSTPSEHEKDEETDEIQVEQNPEKDEETDEIQVEQNPESSNKNRKSVSFDDICKSMGIAPTEGGSSSSSSCLFPQVAIPDSLAVHEDASLERKKMMRQKNINLAVDEDNMNACVSVSKTSSTTSISAIGSLQAINEPSSGHCQKNPSLKIPCQQSTLISSNSSPRLSTIRERRQRNWWNTPVSIDERIDQNYKELYQLMTRDVEVKGKERQLIHAHQMEQLYEKYISASYGKIPPIVLYPHNWPHCVIRRLFCPTLSTLHSTLTNYSNSTSFVRPTYVIPRSALSVKNDSSMKKVKKVRESKETKCESRLNNQMCVEESQKSRVSSNGQRLENSLSAQFVDHRLGHSTNPDILKWLNGKNQMFWKQKKEEKVQKKLERETKRLETLTKAERRLQSQQAVYNWMQQKLKESQQSSLEDKSCAGKKTEIKKSPEENFSDGAEDKTEQHKNGEQVGSKKFSESQSKLKSHLKPLQGQIKTNKEKKFQVKNSNFKHMESDLNYSAWTRQTVNEGCTKVSNHCHDSVSSIKSKKKIVKEQDSHYSTDDSKYLGKEKENISLQENGNKLKANEEKQLMRKQTTRPKTAHGTRRTRLSSNSNFLDVSKPFDEVKKSHFEEEKQDGKLTSGNTSRLNETLSYGDLDLDEDDSQNEGIKRLEIMDDKKGDYENSEITEISSKEL